MKNKKCLGCGVKLQSENILNMGYTPNLEKEYCMRCFKVMNYGEVSNVVSNKEDYEKILRSVSRSHDLVLYIVDILNIRENLEEIKEILTNDIVLVLNKRDVLPKSVKDEKIINYIKERYNFLDIVVVSSLKNYQIDLLYKKILKHKQSNNVYLVGETNAGKSSLINQMIKNYSEETPFLTTSNVPETTLNKISIELNKKLTLIDTPGIVDNQNIIHFLGKKYYKLLNERHEIKPKTYSLVKGQSLLVGDFFRIDYQEGDKNSFTLYLPNSIKVKRINSRHEYLTDLAVKNYEVSFHEDLVIYGLGFVKMVLPCQITIYLDKDIKTFLRKNLI